MTGRDGAAAPPEYTIRRSERAHRARLTITEGGEAVVVLPARAPASLAASLVAQHATWLRRQLARHRDRRRRLAERPPLTGGRVLAIAGVAHRVLVTRGDGSTPARGRVERGWLFEDAGEDTDSLAILTVHPGRDGRAPGDLLEGWLRAEARRVLEARAAAFGDVMGLAPARIAIRGQRSRWGSASRAGTLSLNWRLILAPPSVLDYVVVHELAHLRYAGHGPRFWGLVRKHAPDHLAARRWLREQHGSLMAALD